MKIHFLPLLENKKVWGSPYLEIHKFGGFTKFSISWFLIDMKFISKLSQMVFMESLSFPILIFVKHNIKMIYSQKKRIHTWSINIQTYSEFLMSVFTKVIFVQEVLIISLGLVEAFWYQKWINTGFQGSGNPEIMNMSSFYF